MASNGSGMAQVKNEMVGNGGLPANHTQDHPRDQLPTFIYDYLRKARKPELAQKVLDEFNCKTHGKSSPGNKVNGAGLSEDQITKKLEALPEPDLQSYGHPSDTSFLQEWWHVFWDLWAVGRPGAKNPAAAQYMSMRNRSGMGVGNTVAGIRLPQNMANGMPNMMDPNRQRAMMNRQNGVPQNRNFSQGGQMGQAREGAGMDASGQGRPQSPMSNENAPSPSKRPRLGENDPFGGQAIGPNRAASLGPQMNRPGGPGGPLIANGFDGSMPGPQQFSNMQQNPRMGGFNAPMNMGMMSSEFQPDVFGGANHAAQYQRNPQGANANNAQGGALADYQMQLMLLEQQNKKRLLMARQEQDVNQPNGVPNVNTPMPMGQPGMPHVSRGSPAPGAGFDPSQIPGGMSTFMGSAPGGMMMRPGAPPFSGPGGSMNPQQMEMLRRQTQQNGGQPPNMPPGSQGAQQPPGSENAQRPNPMPPPNVPQGASGAQRQPSPQQTPAAPPTPGNKPNASKAKKDTKDKKAQKPTKKGPNATPNTETEQPPTPTPNTPITPVAHNKGALGQQQANAAAANNNNTAANNSNDNPPASGAPPDAMVHDGMNNNAFGNELDNFNMDFNMHDNSDVLDGFDFDSFLQMDGNQQQGAFDLDPTNFGNFGDGVEMGTGGS